MREQLAARGLARTGEAQAEAFRIYRRVADALRSRGDEVDAAWSAGLAEAAMIVRAARRQGEAFETGEQQRVK